MNDLQTPILDKISPQMAEAVALPIPQETPSSLPEDKITFVQEEPILKEETVH